MRNFHGTLVIAILSGVCAFPSSLLACSIRESLEQSDSMYVLLGKIDGYISKPKDGRSVYGITIKPLVEFQTPDTRGSDGYRAFPPRGLSPDCRSSYYIEKADLERRYPLNSTIAVWANRSKPDSANTGTVLLGQSLEVLPNDCDPTSVAQATPNYSERGRRCGSLFFHAYKEIAQLDSGNQEEVMSVLERIAEFPHFTHFENLVESFVANADDRNRLIQLRYAGAIESGCKEQPDYITDYGPDYFKKRAIRGRWFEYCNNERIRAGKDGA